MSARGETITFCATSLGRNNYLQSATGIFGGDFNWSTGTYRPVNVDYDQASNNQET